MGDFGSPIWLYTQGYGFRGPRLEYLTDEQNCRHERIRVARMLWRGEHRRAYLDEGRTQFDWPQMKTQGRLHTPYLTLNILRLITTTITDLMIGAEPLLKVEGQQQSLDDLVNRSNIHRVLYDAAKEASWAAETTVEVARWDGQVYLKPVPPGELYPLGEMQPDGQYAAYRRFATACVNKQHLLLETTYEPGRVTRHCWLLDGTAKRGEMPLSAWPVKNADGSDLLPEEVTGLPDQCNIVWMANEMDEGRPTCDYDGLVELQDELNAKQTQIARVLAKHSDPKLLAPAEMANLTGDLSARKDVFFFRNGEEKPAYLTWNAELASAIDDRDFTLNALCIAAELSPVLLGIKSGATPDAARKLRLEATKSLARKDRKAAYFRPFVRAAIDTALAMENAGRRVALAMGDSSVELRDGLPVDDLDEAQTLQILTAGKAVMSVERAVERQIPDPAAAAIELQRLAAAAGAAQAAAVVAGGSGTAIGDTAGAAAAAVKEQTMDPERSPGMRAVVAPITL